MIYYAILDTYLQQGKTAVGIIIHAENMPLAMRQADTLCKYAGLIIADSELVELTTKKRRGVEYLGSSLDT